MDNPGEIEVLTIAVGSNRITKWRYIKDLNLAFSFLNRRRKPPCFQTQVIILFGGIVGNYFISCQIYVYMR